MREQLRAAGRSGAGALSSRDVAKFAAGVALLAIFWDAAVGHGLLWENDPYWTYWITKTFLIFTIFGLGTAWLGIGVGAGAVITAVHTLVLTVYYWTFSPIGLPSSPDWLDLEHTWITGVPIHFGVIYLGYLATLWLWQRRAVVVDRPPGREALVVLVAGLAIVVLAGGVASLVLYDWPGVTYFLVRLLITVPFLLLWFALAGRDWVAAVAGAATLAFIWATYGEYLGPVGLPDTPLRILDQEPPPATSGWLDYRENWLISLPIYLVSMTVVLLAAAAALAAVPWRRAMGRRSAFAAPLAVSALLVAPLLLANIWVDSGGENARLEASGSAQVEQGGWYSGDFTSADATLSLEAEDHIRKVTPLPPHDQLEITATVDHPDGNSYEITVGKPMVSDAAGRHTTWWGVGLDVWHHGKSGIGSDEIPAVRADVAVFGIGEIGVDGEPVAVNVPVHVMTGDGEFGGRLELDVGDAAALVPALPDGHLRVVWPEYEGGADRDGEWTRYALGAFVLVLLVLLALRANGAAAVDAAEAARRRTT